MIDDFAGFEEVLSVASAFFDFRNPKVYFCQRRLLLGV